MDDLTYTEICAQEYNDCKFSAGFLEGHPVDTVYLKIVGEGREDLILFLRPDEMAAIAWVCNGTMWSQYMEALAANRV